MEIQNKSISFDDYLKGINALTIKQQLDLINALAEKVKLNIGKKRIRKYSIMDLEGLGAEIWKGIDVQQFVSKERASWG